MYNPSMKLGMCVSLENAPLAVEAGFDYVELGAGQMTMMEPWDPATYLSLPVKAMNLFFAGHLDIYAKNDWIPYTKTLVERSREIGVEKLVVGSGAIRKSRKSASLLDALHATANGCKIPSNSQKAESEFLKILAKIQKANNVILCPESLNRTETDCFNDCGTLATETKKKGIGYTADSYHLLYEWDANGREGGKSEPTPYFWQEQMPHTPNHVHIATLEGRSAPQPNDPLLLGFFERLRKLNYNGMMSLECSGLEPADYRESLTNLRTYIND